MSRPTSHCSGSVASRIADRHAATHMRDRGNRLAASEPPAPRRRRNARTRLPSRRAIGPCPAGPAGRVPRGGTSAAASRPRTGFGLRSRGDLRDGGFSGIDRRNLYVHWHAFAHAGTGRGPRRTIQYYCTRSAAERGTGSVASMAFCSADGSWWRWRLSASSTNQGVLAAEKGGGSVPATFLLMPRRFASRTPSPILREPCWQYTPADAAGHRWPVEPGCATSWGAAPPTVALRKTEAGWWCRGTASPRATGSAASPSAKRATCGLR